MKNALIVAASVLTLLLVLALAGWFGAQHWHRFAALMPDPQVDAVAKARGAEEKLAAAKNLYDRWVALGDVALWTADTAGAERSRAAANELLAMLETYKDDWNYGNAVHKAHSALGRLALKQGDRATAREHLLRSARSYGSPQMNTFGPNMLFAREMLEAGEKDAVREYLNLCGTFWEMGDGQIAIWQGMIAEGKMPAFGPNLLY